MNKFLKTLMVIAGLFALPGAVFATEIPIPNQSEWAAAKKTVELKNGVKMAYNEMGDTSGKPLLLIHGLTDNSRTWSLMVPFLKGKYHIYAIDLRGHGMTSAPECCYTISDFAYDAKLFLDAMNIDKADVVGHSLGSFTTQGLAARYPEKVNKVVLVSTAITGGSGPGGWLWDNVMPVKEPFDPNSKFMMEWYWSPKPVDQTFIKHMREESAAVPLHVWKGAVYDVDGGTLAHKTSLITAPTMIFWGDQDPLMNAAAQEPLKKAFPKARYEVFPGFGHNMFWEDPQRAASLIDDFLK